MEAITPTPDQVAQPDFVRPTAGRIVHYVPEPGRAEANNGAPFVPAMITRTWEHTSYERNEVNLTIFPDLGTPICKGSVPYSETNEPRSWHWPPRV